MGVDPFSIWTNYNDGLLSHNNNAGFITLISLISGIALISIIWQGIGIMRDADDQKNVSERKRNILKILIAYLIIITIGFIIRQANMMKYNFNNPSRTTNYYSTPTSTNNPIGSSDVPSTGITETE